MRRSDFLFIAGSFLIWRIILFVFLFIAIKLVPLQQNFLGGGMRNYLSNPWLWSWINFDGEHYLTIAQSGYQPLTYFYFPVFPILARLAGNIFGGGFGNYAVAGIIVSNVGFLAALIGLWKLIALDFDRRIVRMTLLLLLLFPTSLYFGSYYTESIFLALTVWSFYFVRRNAWIHGGILGSFSTAARIIGVALAPAFLIELLRDKRKSFTKLIGIFLIPVGIGTYMYYLELKTGDPLNFLNTVSIFGAQRSSSFILLPQVFYRYLFKVLPAINLNYLPGVFTTYLELVVAVLFLVMAVISFWKLRPSYAVYLALGYLIPTLSGSFSSLPRYVLILFPAFLLSALYISKLPRIWKLVVFSILFAGLGISTVLFTRGFWVA